MPNRIGRNGELLGVRGKRGAFQYSKRDYVTRRDVRPRRNAFRAAPVGPDPEEFRMANVEGSNLERILYKRLTLLVGEQNVGFIYKFQHGAAAGFDARAMVGGLEADFIVLNRPSSQGLVLEPQGAQWHGPVDQYHDTDRAYVWIALGYEYAEIMEWEVDMGDEYVDRRLSEILGVPIPERQRELEERGTREIREIQPGNDRPRTPLLSR